MNGKQKEAEKIEQEVLKRNPKPHEFYFRAGDLLENRRQFDVAEYYIRKAVDAGPHLAAPLNSLGMLLMRIGKEDEARTVIAKARELDPFHIRVKNFSLVLEELSKYKVIESPTIRCWSKPPTMKCLANTCQSISKVGTLNCARCSAMSRKRRAGSRSCRRTAGLVPAWSACQVSAPSVLVPVEWSRSHHRVRFRSRSIGAESLRTKSRT